MAKPKPVSKLKPAPKSRPQLPKAPTGIQRLDEITGGGFGPRCRCHDHFSPLLFISFLLRGQ